MVVQDGPPPFWVRLRVHQVVYGGDGIAKVCNAATTSHYGMASIRPGVQLVFLRTDGSQSIMQRYGGRPLVRKRDGSLHLPIWDGEPAPWLPCAAMELREELDSGTLQSALAAEGRDYGPVGRWPDLFHIGDGGVLPRYAIDVRKLADYLRSHPPGTRHIGCGAAPGPKS